MAEFDDGRPSWDEEIALDLMGSLVLVGITRLAHDGTFIRQEQMFGRVVVADRRSGVCLHLDGVRAGEYKWLPPATDFFKRASPGVYKLRSTGEEVVDPDFLTSYTVTAPPPDWKPDDDEDKDKTDKGLQQVRPFG